MKIYSNKETWSSKRKRFWAELKKVLGWTEKWFWVEKKRATRELKKRKRGGAERERKEALNQKRKKQKNAETGKKKKVRCWRAETEKREVLKLKGRGAEIERQRLNWEDWDEIYFQHLFSFESLQKNDGEFVYVEFNF